MKLKGLTLALVFTLIGAAAVSVDAANINGDVIDEELLDGEMDVDEVFGNVESGTGPEDMEDESEDSEGELEGFDVEGFLYRFSEEEFNSYSDAFTSESDPVNTVYDDYSLQTELLDGEMDMDEVVGSVESGTGPEDMEDESEDSEGGLEGFDVEGFIDGFIVDIFNFFSNAFTQDSEGELEGI